MPRRARLDPRKMPSQARARVTVDAIVTAAARALVEVGYERANVNEIAARAGVSVGSLYQYFPSKEALVGAVVRAHTDAMIAAFGAVDLDAVVRAPLPEAVRALVARVLAAYAVAPELRRVIVEQVPYAHRFMLTEAFDAWLRDAARAYLEVRRAEVRPSDLDLAVLVLQTAVESVVARVAREDPARLGDAAFADEMGALILGYLAPR